MAGSPRRHKAAYYHPSRRTTPARYTWDLPTYLPPGLRRACADVRRALRAVRDTATKSRATWTALAKRASPHRMRGYLAVLMRPRH